MKYDLTYLSLGAGVQSTALYILSSLGELGCPRADVAVFADTQDEPAYVYEALDRLEAWGKRWCGDRAIPIERCTNGRLSDRVITGVKTDEGRDRFITIPAFVAGQNGKGSPLRRQCTREFKVDPLERHVRKILGLKPGDRAAGRFSVLNIIGISLDEATRMKDSRTPWIEHDYPLVNARLRRDDCERLIAAADHPVPEKSACVFCPYHSDRFWKELRDRYPAEFARACAVDEAIRAPRGGQREQPFLHRSLKPLAQVNLDGHGQRELFGEDCEGRCGL